jgi:hypothetical protein
MSRASHIPVCRLHYLPGLPAAPTPYRRAQRGDYGPLSYDGRGRQQVSLAAVELAEGRVFAPEEIAHALATPSRHGTHDRLKANELQRLAFGLTINADQDFYSKREAEAFALSCVQNCNRQWRTFLMLQRNSIR